MTDRKVVYVGMYVSDLYGDSFCGVFSTVAKAKAAMEEREGCILTWRQNRDPNATTEDLEAQTEHGTYSVWRCNVDEAEP